MQYTDLRDFCTQLQKIGELKTITQAVSPHLEMTAIADVVLRQAGPALMFSKPVDHQQVFQYPVLANLFGTPKRVALGMGQSDISALREVGQLLSELKEPAPPKSLKESGKLLHMAKAVWDMSPKMVKGASCQEIIISHQEVDLAQLPIQTCWPGDAAPLITWGLVVTQGPQNCDKPQKRQNLGIYRQQVISRNQVIMRWLSHRGGALDFREWALTNPGKPFPIAVVLGADPATTLGAVTPVPDTLSEYQFAGLLRGGRTELTYCLTKGLEHIMVPARAEIILEGFIYPTQTAPHPIPTHLQAKQQELTNKGIVSEYQHALEGPYGDHTGYYNEQDFFPVFTIERITTRRDAIYHSTYTGKPPDEPAVLGVALNEVFIPLLQKQFPEIIDFYLPPEGCSYRMAIVSMKKAYPGHAKRVMMGVWSFLRQFMYTKFIVVVDDDINTRDWKEVIWAITTRVDPLRDTTLVANTPIDYLDFASPISGLGSKMGIDATNKWPGETDREWGRGIVMDQTVIDRVAHITQSILQN